MVTQAWAQEAGEAQDPTAGTHGEVQSHGGGGSEAFPPMNPEFFPSQLLWLAITFGIFYIALRRVLLPRIGGILENRRDRIALDLEAADRMKMDGDEAYAAYQQELTEARERAHAIAQDARDKARDQADKERARLDRDLDEKLEASQARIDEVKATAMAEVDGIARDVATAILRDVVRLDVAQDEIDRAVASAKGEGARG